MQFSSGPLSSMDPDLLSDIIDSTYLNDKQAAQVGRPRRGAKRPNYNEDDVVSEDELAGETTEDPNANPEHENVDNEEEEEEEEEEPELLGPEQQQRKRAPRRTIRQKFDNMMEAIGKANMGGFEAMVRILQRVLSREQLVSTKELRSKLKGLIKQPFFDKYLPEDSMKSVKLDDISGVIKEHALIWTALLTEDLLPNARYKQRDYMERVKDKYNLIVKRMNWKIPLSAIRIIDDLSSKATVNKILREPRKSVQNLQPTVEEIEEDPPVGGDLAGVDPVEEDPAMNVTPDKATALYYLDQAIAYAIGEEVIDHLFGRGGSMHRPKWPVMDELDHELSTSLSLPVLMHDEGTLKGTYAVHDDIWLHFLKFAKEDFKAVKVGRLWLIHGDQITIERARTVIREMVESELLYDKKDWMLPIPA
ncbi:unnamed protein product [Zymoseptoria tritici ST99CH_1E4]|uniref:DUF6589 domain-containing protein n=1 Tax=Zymoseptoria tritici ST99CH_1E4 TaxID=1276532 RepID=A0A2H1H8M5_ZYMTR|nr:unnamed protein product [Zymoseptoria tritici ST99CH_1E4]